MRVTLRASQKNLARYTCCSMPSVNLLVSCTVSQMHSSKYLPSEKKEMVKSSKTKIDAFITKTIYSEGHAKKISNLIAEMIVLDLRLAAMVEGTEFIHFLNYIEPRYRVPSAINIIVWQIGEIIVPLMIEA